MSSALLSPRWRAVAARCRLPAVCPPGFFQRVMPSWKSAQDEGRCELVCPGRSRAVRHGCEAPSPKLQRLGEELGIIKPLFSLRNPVGFGPALPQSPPRQLPVMELSLSDLCGDTCTGGGDAFLSPPTLQDLPSSFPLRRTSRSTSPRMRSSPARPRRTPGTSPTCGTGRRRTSTSKSAYPAGWRVLLVSLPDPALPAPGHPAILLPSSLAAT